MFNGTARRVLICAGIIVSLSMGIRHGFGFFLQPITQDFGWNREVFALALGLQNLVWGAAQPFTGALADRYGATRVLVVGALLYAAGLALMTVSSSGWMFSGSAGVLLGLALSGSTYSIVFGVIGRAVPESQRSQAMGIASAAGSFGQFMMVPVEQQLISGLGWMPTLLILSAMSLLIIPAARGLKEVAPEAGHGTGQSVWAAAREAFRYPSFQMLMAGYFVCGFQVVFIGVHLPAYLKDFGLPGSVAAVALALIGLFNVFGTYTAGQLGARFGKKYLLSMIYLARAVAISVFLLAPLTAWSVWLFAAVIGFLWLSTVPLTNGVIATIFGVKHLGMLSGFVFFSHQIGSFLGVWLGGWLYDHTGSYNVVWYISIGLGIGAALINWPIREQAIGRPAAMAAT
ncbi:MFS transporter [Chitinimonas prasina]|uniref:MFS transporter n=1 Tax=Chitinimonas prasina TaxID=1434937 RepID=A0ABQ5YGV7_9NEIS|nr:MFS transporter [Chitinimonas prasina]GLR13811.1 MFS transporter [Chitinimonas prasina]